MNLPRHHEGPMSPMTNRERMELRAIEVAREVGISHRPPRDRALVREYDAIRREWYESAVYTWPSGDRITVDGRSLDVEIERTP